MGSHPLTDPLWSTEGTEIVHEGAEVGRADKVAKIAENPAALACLMVCANSVTSNCGRCEKCLRTMIALRALGVSTTAFPEFPPLSHIRRLRIANDNEMIFFRENYEFVSRSGDRALLDAMTACLRRHDRKRLAKELDRTLLGGLTKRIVQRVTSGNAPNRRITMTPPTP
jgi:hypothetical protein